MILKNANKKSLQIGPRIQIQDLPESGASKESKNLYESLRISMNPSESFTKTLNTTTTMTTTTTTTTTTKTTKTRTTISLKESQPPPVNNKQTKPWKQNKKERKQSRKLGIGIRKFPAFNFQDPQHPSDCVSRITSDPVLLFPFCLLSFSCCCCFNIVSKFVASRRVPLRIAPNGKWNGASQTPASPAPGTNWLNITLIESNHVSRENG